MKTTIKNLSGSSTRTFLSLGLFLFITIQSAIGYSAAPPKSAELAYYGAGFYSDLKSGVRDESLKTEIRTILRSQHVPQNGDYDQIVNACTGQAGCYGHKVLGYFNARVLLMGQMYLVNTDSTYAIHDFYCNSNRSATEFGSKPPAPNQIPQETIVNTEHTWPQSRFNLKYASEEQKSDVHHLFPTDSKINATRGNHEFGEVQKELQSLSCSEAHFGLSNESGSVPVFEPPQAHKGHVARALFYFSIRYELPISTTEEVTLKKWHRENPPDQDEIEKNNIIFKAQGDRNPFIDYPELADQISDF